MKGALTSGVHVTGVEGGVGLGRAELMGRKRLRVGLSAKLLKGKQPTTPNKTLVFKLLGLNIGLNRSLNLNPNQIQTSHKRTPNKPRKIQLTDYTIYFKYNFYS
jgi:hypothetical protein